MQSQQVVLELDGPKGVCIYGGVPKGVQKAELSKGVDVVVATPGRLQDLLSENALSLSGTNNEYIKSFCTYRGNHRLVYFWISCKILCNRFYLLLIDIYSSSLSFSFAVVDE